jgi:hypothetical protein
MDTIREQLNKPLVTGVAGLVVGLIIGLVVLGWGLWPVKWVDASPAFLRDDAQQDYLRMTVDSYLINGDQATAISRWQELGSSAPKILAEIKTNPKLTNVDKINDFAEMVKAAGVSVPAAVATTGAGTVSPTSVSASGTTGEESKPSASTLPVVLGVTCVLVLIVAAALGYFFMVRNRRVVGAAPTAGGPAPAPQKSAESQIFSPTRQEAPVAQFMTTYMTGDDLYDDSFSIDSPSGEFLGECGVGISDTIGVGDPKKVTALEVWLFDKNDIQTVTKVLMSEHAFNDLGIRQRLESKGEPILTEPGKHILLETATLQLEARVVDMNYGQGAMPPCSFFDRLTLELAVWPKA